MILKKIIRCGILIVVFLIAVGLMLGYLLHYDHKQQDKLRKEVLRLYQDIVIPDAQKTGCFAIYDPILLSRKDHLLELFSLLFQKDKIHRIVFDGSSSHVIGKSMIEYVASMPDIEVLEMSGVVFQGDDVFTPFAGNSTFSSLDIRRCFAGTELYKSIFREKSIKRLTILLPFIGRSTDGTPNTTAQCLSPFTLMNFP